MEVTKDNRIKTIYKDNTSSSEEDDAYSTTENLKFSSSEMMGETRRKEPLHFGLDKKGSDEIPICKHTYEENDVPADDLRAEYLRWHHRLGHMSCQKMKILAMIGILPKKLASIENPPLCSSCMYGAMKRVPWKTSKHKKKGDVNNKMYPIKKPGDCVSVDQLESRDLGFVAQLKGKLKTNRYKAATVFVDQHSRKGYVFLQKSLTSEETLLAKNAFEAHARNCGIKIKHYHADNGRFADNSWKKDIDEKGQTISYCGVNAHYQNEIAEKRIRDLTERARKMLLHAKSRWPEAITVNLWPYALRAAQDQINLIPNNLHGESYEESFTGVQVSAKAKNFRTFGCPVYALNNNLQSGSKIGKWEPRARMGINLGFSPRHARNVSLVLSLETGLVSPQFHVRHDDLFESVRLGQHPQVKSNWQKLSGFHKYTNEVKLEPPISQSDVKLNVNHPNMPETTSLNDEDIQIGSPPDVIQETPQVRRSDRLKNVPRVDYDESKVAYSAYYDALH